MSEVKRLALAGCGGMGRRHLRSYQLLENAEPGQLELVAVIDPELERANFVAAEAEQLLGLRPQTFRSVEDAVVSVSELRFVDIVTAVSAHHIVARDAADAGLHVLCEKPMAPTIRACRIMQIASEQAGTVLSVAENYRRDPISRLAQALIVNGAIGEVRSLLDLSGSGGNHGQAGPWRYRRSEGGPILESAVHNADMQQFLVGKTDFVSAEVRLHEVDRIYDNVPLKAFHDHYAHTNPKIAIADAPDFLMATIQYVGGALGKWLYDESVHGPGIKQFTIYGSEGQINLAGLRSGRSLSLYRDDCDRPLTGSSLLDFVPDFALDERTARLFGGERLTSYKNDEAFLGSQADLKLLALELGELVDAVDGQTSVEVGPEEGLGAVAQVIACHESSFCGRKVSMAEVVDGHLDVYQQSVNHALGIDQP